MKPRTAIVVALFLGLLAACGPTYTYVPPPPPVTSKPPAMRTRQQWRQFMGKHHADIKPLVGKPWKADDYPDGSPKAWWFEYSSWDETTQSIDTSVVLFFDRDGKVETILP